MNPLRRLMIAATASLAACARVAPAAAAEPAGVKLPDFERVNAR